MIIDVHGHYTTAPAEQQRFRTDQLAALDDPRLPPPERPKITDDEIRESIELNQLTIRSGRGHPTISCTG
jgi:4-oxalmesaconate hydratase